MHRLTYIVLITNSNKSDLNAVTYMQKRVQVLNFHK